MHCVKTPPIWRGGASPLRPLQILGKSNKHNPYISVTSTVTRENEIMNPSTPQPVQNASSRHSTSQFTDPFFLLFIILYGLAFLGLLFTASRESQSAAVLAGGVTAVSALIRVVFRRYSPPPLKSAQPRTELKTALTWYVIVFLLAAFTDARGIELINGFTNWLFLFLIPIVLVRIAHGHTTFHEFLTSVGFSSHGLIPALKVTLLAAFLFLPVILGSVSTPQRVEILTIFHTGRVAILFPISFVLALLLAGFTEEFFFRGILQSRLALKTSELRGLVITSLLFGLVHAPHAYFLSTWPTHGDPVWSLARVMTEYAIMGVLLGVVWAKTHNLAAPVFVHAFVNAFVLMTSLRVGTG